jgi:alkyl hydroperoxide reductase subunit AhpC
MLSDFKREVSRLYGVLNEDTFFSQRAYFLIDRSGVIGWRHVEGIIADRRENREIIDAIKTIEG